MKTSVFFIILFFFVAFSATVSKTPKNFSTIKPTVHYSSVQDSIESYMNISRRSTKVLKKKMEEISKNQGYSVNLEYIKEGKKIALNKVIQETTDIIAQKIEFKKAKKYTDSTCTKERGFIGKSIFGKSNCKEWDIHKYYINKKGDTTTIANGKRA